MSPPCKTIELKPGLQISYTGPDLSAGPLPALFYLFISAEESLDLDPFNQPVTYLSALPLRIFSLTLPGHENNLSRLDAMERWAKAITSGDNFIEKFTTRLKDAVDTLIDQNVLIEDKIAVAGLSRGGFLAVHAAVSIPQFRWILGFAPLTQLSILEEFKQIPDAHSTSLELLVDKLTDRVVRFYIGNLDIRVGTRACFDFIEKLSQAAFEKGIRSPQVELIINPSIGRDGHGTPKAVFHDGAQWVAEQLGAVDVM